MEEYNLINLVSRGSKTRAEVQPTMIVSDGNYKKGTLLDANTINKKLLESSIDVDLSNYPTKDEIEKAIDTINDSKADKTQLNNYLTKTDASNTYQPKGNYLTQHQSLADYAKSADVNKAITDLANTVENNYAQKDGIYEDLVAGTAANLEGKNDIINASMYRPTGGNYDVDSGVVSINSIQGNAVAWNQLVKNGDFEDNVFGSDSSGEWNKTSSTKDVSISNNVLSVNLKEEHNGGYGVLQILNERITKDHKYIIRLDARKDGDSYTGAIYAVTSLLGVVSDTITSTWKTYSKIFDAERYGTSLVYLRLYQNDPDLSTFYYRNICLFDLTLIYGAGNEPSTPEQFEADYQRWFGKTLEYEEYDEGSIRTVLATGIKTVGFNLWDEIWEVGQIHPNNGIPMDSEYCIRSSNFCKILPNREYYLKCGDVDNIYYLDILFYDSNFNFISHIYKANDTVISPSNAAYFKLSTNPGTYIYGNTYHNDICVSLVWSGKRDGEYEPYWEETKALPITELTSNGEKIFPDGLKRAGNVYDEIFVENGVTKAIKRVGSVDLGTVAWSEIPDYENRFFTNVTGSKHIINFGILNAKYSTSYKFWKDLLDKEIVSYSAGSDGRVAIYDTSYTTKSEFKQSLQGVLLYYELAEPITYTIDNFQLPLAYKVDDFGTEQIVSPEDSVAPVLVTRYGINAVDTLRRLPQNYISVQSMDEFLTQLGSVISGKFNRIWNEQKGCYTFSFIDELEPESLETEE